MVVSDDWCAYLLLPHVFKLVEVEYGTLVGNSEISMFIPATTSQFTSHKATVCNGYTICLLAYGPSTVHEWTSLAFK